MVKELFGFFYRSWLVNIVLLIFAVSVAALYYPFNYWMTYDQWRWESIDQVTRYYIGSIPIGFAMALIFTFTHWLEMRDKGKV